jgi:protein ImuB
LSAQRTPPEAALAWEAASKAGHPFALIAPSKSALRLTSLCPMARSAGLRIGEALSDARARVPTLVTAPADPSGDTAALERLARRMVRWTPWASPLETHNIAGVTLDLTGCAHLFGGEEALLARMQRTLANAGFAPRIALAHSLGAAWALSAFHPGARKGLITSRQEATTWLDPLPVEALRLDAASITGLRAAGLKTIASVKGQARVSLTRRFGALLCERLDDLAGQSDLPISPLAPRLIPHAERRLMEPLTDMDAIFAMLGDLSGDLCASLSDKGIGARKLVLTLWRVDGADLDLRLEMANPEARADRIVRLFRHRLDALAARVDLGFGVEGATLRAIATAPLRAFQDDLDPVAAEEAAAGRATRDLAERLTARLGAACVRRPDEQDAWLPEDADRTAPASAAITQTARPSSRPRPVLVYAQPEAAEAIAEAPDGPPRTLRWRRQMLRIVAADGPERIAPPWWNAKAPTRDYYRIETATGLRLWVFRAGPYLATQTGDAPRWFVHGQFG